MLNEATGYSHIEKQKLLVEKAESEIEQAREAVRAAKAKYEKAIQNRSDSQKEINELLTRKHTWSPADVERFTELYKNDHRNQNEEVMCKKSTRRRRKLRGVRANQTHSTDLDTVS
ncbi:hypothetical protein OXX80_013764 [Metschnikowia pulcherrima]